MNIMYSTLCTVHRTRYTVQYTVHRTLYSTPYTVHTVKIVLRMGGNFLQEHTMKI